MKTLISVIIAFILGVLAGGYWGIQQTKSKVIDLATEMYQSGIQSAIATTGTVSNELKGVLQAESDKYIEQFKEQAKSQASEYLKQQIDEMLK